MENNVDILNELNELINNEWCVGDLSTEALNMWDKMYSRRLNNMNTEANRKKKNNEKA